MAARARGTRVRAQVVEHAVLDQFCDALWLEDGLARNTIASYRTDLAQLAKFLNGKSLLQAGEAELFAFLAAAKGRASSAARRVSTLKRFYQYCVRERRVDADPTLKLDPPKRAPRFPKTLTAMVYEPRDISHIFCAYSPFSPGTVSARSAGGAPFSPAFQ